MKRLALAALLFAGMAVAGPTPTFALDYAEPVVPPELLLGGPPAPPTGPAGPPEVTLQSSGVEWTRAGAPGELRYIPRDQFQAGGPGGLGGCAVWNWSTC